MTAAAAARFVTLSRHSTKITYIQTADVFICLHYINNNSLSLSILTAIFPGKPVSASFTEANWAFTQYDRRIDRSVWLVCPTGRSDDRIV